MKDWYYDVTEDDLTESHLKFLDVLSIPDILALCEAFGGVKTHIPQNDKVYKRVIRNREIREMYLKGVKISDIAIRSSISETTVQRIVKGYTPQQVTLFDDEKS